MTDPDICKICLRTNVKLKEIDKVLIEYHQAITDFVLPQFHSSLCLECEHLLRKNYNFNQRCKYAAKILQKWLHQNAHQRTSLRNRTALSILYTQVPQLPLRIYPQDNNNSKIYTHCYKDGQQPPEVNNESILEKLGNDNIKKEAVCNIPEVRLKDILAVKIEDGAFQEVLIQNNILNDNEIVDTGIELVNEYDNDTDVVLGVRDNESLSSDDECLAVKRLRENGDKTLDIIDNMQINASKNTFISKDDIQTEKSDKNIIAKLKLINADLNIIYKNWEKTSLSELPVIPVCKNDNSTKRSMLKKKLGEKDEKVKKTGVVSKLQSLSTDLDSIRKNCEKLINYKEGLMKPKERLRAELTNKFATCTELKTEDGYVINKETIMNCFDRVSECLMRRLWRFVHGKPTLEPRAINTLKHIQNKYQNEYKYESVFHIEYLNTEEKVAEEFEKRQTYQCYLNAKYKCETCYLGFKYEAQMENHRNSHEESAGEFVCSTCGVRHKSKKSLDTHSKSHEAVYKCKLCPLITYYRYSMMNHYHQHEGMEYRCELCNTTFKSKSAYKTHMGLRHSEGTHTCAICGRSLATKRALMFHMSRAHTKESQSDALSNPVRCPVCDLEFASQSAYLRHRRISHANIKSSTQKVENEGLPKRKPVHTCRVCNAVGSSIGWLTLHFRMEHPSVDMALTYADKQLHLCEICGKGYANVYNLRDHLSMHAGVRAHACAKCGLRFHRAVSLAQHSLTHQPPRRACTACGKLFHSQSNLNNHMRGHIGDRRYKCSLCGKGFLHRNALNEHVRGVHYKLRRVRKKDGQTKYRAPADDTSN